MKFDYYLLIPRAIYIGTPKTRQEVYLIRAVHIAQDRVHISNSLFTINYKFTKYISEGYETLKHIVRDFKSWANFSIILKYL